MQVLVPIAFIAAAFAIIVISVKAKRELTAMREAESARAEEMETVRQDA